VATDDAVTSFVAGLRALRVERGLTQTELADRAGISVRALRYLEQGTARRPRVASIRRLADVLEVGVPAADGVTGRNRPAADEPAWRVDVLGPFSVRAGGRPVDVGWHRARCLLALLALKAGRVVSLDEIVDVIWGDEPPASCRNLVHTYVARLRRVVDGSGGPGLRLVTSHGGYRLEVGGDRVDHLRFVELADRAAAASRPARAYELLSEALECWRGPVLADLTDGLRQHPDAVALAQRRLDAAVGFGTLALETGRHEQALPVLRTLAHEEPLHEAVHVRLILMLAASGQRAAAVQAFTRMRRRLADELGIEPSDELTEAYRHVLRPDVSRRPGGGRAAVPAARYPVAAAPAQLPADVAGFTGRADELRKLDAMVAGMQRRRSSAGAVAALVGGGGVGKTALAVHWGHRVRWPSCAPGTGSAAWRSAATPSSPCAPRSTCPSAPCPPRPPGCSCCSASSPARTSARPRRRRWRVRRVRSSRCCYRIEQTRVRGALALAHLDRDRPDIALRYSEQALRLSRAIGYPLGVARAEHTLGLALSRTAGRQAALSHWREARRILLGIGTAQTRAGGGPWSEGDPGTGNPVAPPAGHRGG
jgi:DNA-binding SARP family transcriptional activator/DNA-binding Xre family transcriptional regulator